MGGSQIRVWVSVLAMACLGRQQSASAEPRCQSIQGTFEARQMNEGCQSSQHICTEGRVRGGLEGAYTFSMTMQTPSGESTTPSVAFYTGQSIVTLKRGDVLLGTDTGAIDAPDRKPTAFASLITFHPGGKGSTANATGQIRLRGEVDVSGITRGDYAGKICTP